MNTDPRWHAIWAALNSGRNGRERISLELARYFYDFGCRDVCVSMSDFPYKTDARCCADVSGHYYGNTWYGLVTTPESIESDGSSRVRTLSDQGMIVMAVPAGTREKAWHAVRAQGLDVTEIREY